MVHVFKNVGKRSTVQNFWRNLWITLRNVALFLISSTVSGLLTQAVALDISEAFDRVWNSDPFHKLKSCGLSCRGFGLIWQLRVVLDQNSSQDLVNTGVYRGSNLSLTIFLLYISSLPGDIISDSVILLSMLMVLISIEWPGIWLINN